MTCNSMDNSRKEDGEACPAGIVRQRCRAAPDIKGTGKGDTAAAHTLARLINHREVKGPRAKLAPILRKVGA